MQQRQPRLGDILDDYCPRERRLTNHAVVAMIGDEVKQTRCTTCDAEHEYKHARVPRQRRKPETPAALYSQVLADAPKRVSVDAKHVVSEPPRSNGSELSEPDPARVLHDRTPVASDDARAWADDRGRTDSDDGQRGVSRDRERAAADVGSTAGSPAPSVAPGSTPGAGEQDGMSDRSDSNEPPSDEDGPVHRPLIRATLPRPEGQPPAARPVPEFTIRQPGSRAGRFRQHHGRGGSPFHGGRSNGNVGSGQMRGDLPRPGGRAPAMARRPKHQGHGRKRSR
jgi:hypothetical protein